MAIVPSLPAKTVSAISGLQPRRPRNHRVQCPSRWLAFLAVPFQMEGLMRNTDDRDFDVQAATFASPEADVQRAKTRATHAHQGQFDKAGRPYIEHPERVVGHLVNATADEVVVAWLHDVVEDCGVTLHEVEQDFGATVAVAVNAITRRPDETDSDDYYARVRANPIALKVKAADLADNTDPARLALLDPEQRARLEAKYAHARHELELH